MYRRPRGMGQGSTSGALSVLTQNSGVDWSKIPWYETPFIAVDVGAFKAYCLANPSDQHCTAGPALAPGSVSPGLPKNYVDVTPTGAIPDNPTGETEVNPYTVILPDSSQLPVADLPSLPTSSIPGWAWALGLGVVGLLVVSMVGGRH